MTTQVILGADHAGFEIKEALKTHLLRRNVPVVDVGVSNGESIDYPSIAKMVAERVATGKSGSMGTDFIGVLSCGTGIGMSIAANRIPGVRAALCTSKEMVRLSRAHNDANILILPGRMMAAGDAGEMLDIFLATPFDGGRHERRVNSIDAIDAIDGSPK